MKKLLAVWLAVCLLCGGMAIGSWAVEQVDFLQAAPIYESDKVSVGNNVMMGGVPYHNTITYRWWYDGDGYSLHNLGGRYTTLTGILGPVDGSDGGALAFYGNGLIITSFEIEQHALLRQISVNVAGVQQLKIVGGGNVALTGAMLTPDPNAYISATGVTITGAATQSVVKGETLTLTPNVSPSNATVKAVSWRTDNAAIALVDNSGIVTAVSNGTATITATTACGNHTASVLVRVTDPTPPAPEPHVPAQPKPSSGNVITAIGNAITVFFNVITGFLRLAFIFI